MELLPFRTFRTLKVGISQNPYTTPVSLHSKFLNSSSNHPRTTYGTIFSVLRSLPIRIFEMLLNVLLFVEDFSRKCFFFLLKASRSFSFFGGYLDFEKIHCLEGIFSKVFIFGGSLKISYKILARCLLFY